MYGTSGPSVCVSFSVHLRIVLITLNTALGFLSFSPVALLARFQKAHFSIVPCPVLSRALDFVAIAGLIEALYHHDLEDISAASYFNLSRFCDPVAVSKVPKVLPHESWQHCLFGKADGAHCVNELLSEESLFFFSLLSAVGREALQQRSDRSASLLMPRAKATTEIQRGRGFHSAFAVAFDRHRPLVRG